MRRGLKSILWVCFVICMVDAIAESVALQCSILICMATLVVLSKDQRVYLQRALSTQGIPHRSPPKQKRTDLTNLFEQLSDLNSARPQERRELNAQRGSHKYLVERFDSCVRVFKAQGNKPMLQGEKHNAGELNSNNNFAAVYTDFADSADKGDDPVASDAPTNAVLSAGDELEAKRADGDLELDTSSSDINGQDGPDDVTPMQDTGTLDKAMFLDPKYTETASQTAQKLFSLVTMAAEPQAIDFQARGPVPRPYGVPVLAFAGFMQNELLAVLQCL